METFEGFGEWWDPDQPSTRWPGTFTFDPADGGALIVADPSETASVLAGHREYSVILGETVSGTPVTLLSCFDQSVEGSRPAKRQIFANAAIVGFHASEPDPI